MKLLFPATLIITTVLPRIVAAYDCHVTRNTAADSNPDRPHLCGTPETDFHLDVNPATLFGAAKTSNRELSSTIVLSDYQDGDCLDSKMEFYPYAFINNPTTELSLEDFCKQWCTSVEPEKVVGILLYSGSCYCYFDGSDLPDTFLEVSDYNPEATGSNIVDPGMGCIAQTNDNPGNKCYRNCLYKQCNTESGYESCPITTTTSSAANTSKSGKSSSGTKAGKGSKSMEVGLTGGTHFQFASGAGSGIGHITIEEFSVEIDEAVEEALAETNIGELNIYEGKVSVFKYMDANGDGKPKHVGVSQ